MQAQPKRDTFRFHHFERPIERLPFNPGYSEERRCTICGQDEYSSGPQGAECPGPPPQKAAMQTQPSEMIDRVAAAIYGVAPVGERPWKDAPATTRYDCVLRACAAIEAMREPTEAMLETGGKVVLHIGEHRSSADVWRAMIDEVMGA
jgi:hypothetical protein